MVFGFGIEGFRDKAQDVDQSATFYPALPTESKFSSSFQASKLPDEYLSFFDKFESVVYISFGTMFMPPREEMMRIAETIKISDSQKVGFILSLKTYADSYEDMV